MFRSESTHTLNNALPRTIARAWLSRAVVGCECECARSELDPFPFPLLPLDVDVVSLSLSLSVSLSLSLSLSRSRVVPARLSLSRSLSVFMSAIDDVAEAACGKSGPTILMILHTSHTRAKHSENAHTHTHE